jgi:uroporphyrinogen-III decarboxylase
MIDADWQNLTREQKRERRLNRFFNPANINFISTEAAGKYQERAKRFVKALTCEVPDRVPVLLPTGYFPAYYAGYDLKTVMYDYSKLLESYKKFTHDFDEYMDDYFTEPFLVHSAPALEILDYKPYTWPGHGLKDNVTSYQFVERAYMKENEYPTLLKDPSDFCFRVMLPRSVGILGSLQTFPCLNSLMGSPMGIAYPFMQPEVREAFKLLIKAGEEMQKWRQYVDTANKMISEYGFPNTRGTYVISPFDIIADFLRGTQGIIFDMYRQPDTLLETIDLFTEQIIQRTIETVNDTNGYIVHFPLHKGDDTFMSDKQFEKFYWPSLKKVINALIDEGILVSLFAEGRYNRRLDYIGDFPKGWVIWQFDQTDMAKAKQIVGKTCCIEGNIPTSVLLTGTPQSIKAYCRNLIETCAPGGGYVLSGGATATETSPENFKVLMQAAKEYGMY